MSAERPTLPRGAYIVVGLGKAGRAAADAALALPAAERVLAWDKASTGGTLNTARRLRRSGAEAWLGGDGIAVLDAAGPGATLIKSPGIDLDIPLFEAAASRGLEVLDELELGWRLSKRPIVGVTGTNGKSTTSRLVAAVIETTGHPAHLVGNTEFGPPLSAAPLGGWAVCEVSSFQLEASPLFLPDIAVFTNLTPEHLTRHLNMERYGAAKRRMFVRDGRPPRTAEVAIVNLDDPYGLRLAREARGAGGRVLGYGFHRDADIRILHAEWSAREARLTLQTPMRLLECSSRLPGEHNARNVAAAFAVGHSLGMPADDVAHALEDVDPPPGRWELISGAEPFDVIVDYAHTPDGIQQVLQTARALVSERDGASLRVVFGAVGLKDAEKASESGRLARQLSDQLILTTGSAPRDARIVRLAELRRAASSGGAVEIVLERGAAVERAISAARPGDVVVVLGLGALQRMVLDAAGTVAASDDRELVREALTRVGTATWS